MRARDSTRAFTILPFCRNRVVFSLLKKPKPNIFLFMNYQYRQIIPQPKCINANVSFKDHRDQEELMYKNVQ